MNHPKGFVLIPDDPKAKRLVIAGPGPLLSISLVGLSGIERHEAAEYARRIVEVLNASPMGEEPRRS